MKIDFSYARKFSKNSKLKIRKNSQKISWGTIFRGAIFLGDNFPGGNFLGSNFPWRQFSVGRGGFSRGQFSGEHFSYTFKFTLNDEEMITPQQMCVITSLW